MHVAEGIESHSDHFEQGNHRHIDIVVLDSNAIQPCIPIFYMAESVVSLQTCRTVLPGSVHVTTPKTSLQTGVEVRPNVGFWDSLQGSFYKGIETFPVRNLAPRCSNKSNIRPESPRFLGAHNVDLWPYWALEHPSGRFGVSSFPFSMEMTRFPFGKPHVHNQTTDFTAQNGRDGILVIYEGLRVTGKSGHGLKKSVTKVSPIAVSERLCVGNV